MSQYTLSESDPTACDTGFTPNRFKSSKCASCGHRWNEHSTTTQEQALAAIVAENDGCAQEIIPGIWLGGFKSAMSEKFLKENSISAVLTAAKGLDDFFPLFGKKMKELFHNGDSCAFSDEDHLTLLLLDDNTQVKTTISPSFKFWCFIHQWHHKFLLVPFSS